VFDLPPPSWTDASRTFSRQQLTRRAAAVKFAIKQIRCPPTLGPPGIVVRCLRPLDYTGQPLVAHQPVDRVRRVGMLITQRVDNHDSG
jgi:hypothetical protein